MSISENVGSMAKHLANLRMNSSYLKIKKSTSAIISKIPLIGKMSSSILDRVQNNSDEISLKKPSVKAKSFAFFAFVALPLPLTGVWTGCALSSLLSIGYARSITAIIAGNLASSLIVYILCCFFPTPVINCIITAIGVVALCSIIALFIKVVVKKS